VDCKVYEKIGVRNFKYVGKEIFAPTHRSRGTAHAQWLQMHCRWSWVILPFCDLDLSPLTFISLDCFRCVHCTKQQRTVLSILSLKLQLSLLMRCISYVDRHWRRNLFGRHAKPYHFFKWHGSKCKMSYHFSGLAIIISQIFISTSSVLWL